MNKIVQNFSDQNYIDIVKIVDITALPSEENRGYAFAILLVKALPKEYINKLNNEIEPDHSWFVSHENLTDELADNLATVIQRMGFKAISQSEKGLDSRGEYNQKTKSTILPHKKIALMSGLGWIGKNNLLVTEKYGSAFSMCSVLTDMPLNDRKTKIDLSGKCGKCNLCVNICPARALHGIKWQLNTSRDEIIDVYQCTGCLKCMAGCRYSVAYSKS